MNFPHSKKSGKKLNELEQWKLIRNVVSIYDYAPRGQLEGIESALREKLFGK